jgi:hypothetical protein
MSKTMDQSFKAHLIFHEMNALAMAGLHSKQPLSAMGTPTLL